MKFLKWMAPAAALPLLLCGCGGGDAAGAANRGEGKEGAVAETVREVRLATAEEGRLARTIDVSGTLAADEQAELSFKVAGRLQQLGVDIGSPVRSGQVIARLSPTDFELRVSQAEASLQQARTQLGLPPTGTDENVVPEETALVKQASATLRQSKATRDRMARLFNEKLIPQSDLDAAEAALGVAEGRYQEAIETARTRQGLLAQRRSELAIARQALADSMLRAPFDGVIRERTASVGDYLAAGTQALVIVRVHPLRLRLSIPEREAPGVVVGLPVKLSVEGDPQTYTGKVARISPAITEDNRTLLVEAEVPNSAGRLRPGSFAKAAIVVQASDPAILVPASAIVTFAGIEKVIGVEAGKAVEKKVRTGRRNGDQVEIVEGVKAGEPIVLEPGNIVTGETLKVVS